MMELRPIILDENMVALGGNMRLNALKRLGYKEIPENWVKKVSELTEEEKQQFILKDNVSFGEWDWDMLANEWETEQLEEWGLETVWKGSEYNDMNEDDLDTTEEFDPIGSASGLLKIVFIFDTELEAKNFMDKNHKDIQYKKFGGGQGKIWQVNLSNNYGK